MAQHRGLRIIQISDTHLYAQPGRQVWGVDVDNSLAAVLERLKARHCPADLVLVTGDLAQEADAEAYRRLRTALEPLDTPVYCLAGNHDITAILAQTLNAYPVWWKRHVIQGTWQFILLDSTVPASPAGHLAEAELAFLADTLNTHPQYALVCLHHQPLPIGSPWLDTMTVANGAALFAILDRHPQVRAVIWGHVHQSFSGRRKRMMLLSAPSTCVQFKPEWATPEPDTVPPGYRWFELYPDGTLVTDVERANTVF